MSPSAAQLITGCWFVHLVGLGGAQEDVLEVDDVLRHLVDNAESEGVTWHAFGFGYGEVGGVPFLAALTSVPC